VQLLHAKSLVTLFLLLLNSIMRIFWIILFLAVTSLGLIQRQKPPVLPERIQATFLSTSDSACSSSSLIDEEVRKAKNVILSEISFRPCECGGPEWERVAYYNFSKKQCPPDFTRHSEQWNNVSCHPNMNNKYKSCLGSTYFISSLVLPVQGRSYSSVCGRVRGHGLGFAFVNALYCNAGLMDHLATGPTSGPLLLHTLMVTLIYQVTVHVIATVR